MHAFDCKSEWWLAMSQSQMWRKGYYPLSCIYTLTIPSTASSSIFNYWNCQSFLTSVQVQQKMYNDYLLILTSVRDSGSSDDEWSMTPPSSHQPIIYPRIGAKYRAGNPPQYKEQIWTVRLEITYKSRTDFSWFKWQQSCMNERYCLCKEYVDWRKKAMLRRKTVDLCHLLEYRSVSQDHAHARF